MIQGSIIEALRVVVESSDETFVFSDFEIFLFYKRSYDVLRDFY